MTEGFTAPNGDVFRIETSLFEVTSLRRPDTGWRFTDAQGHEHRWFEDGQQADGYNPSAKHSTPTLKWVKTGEEYYDGDDEPHDVGHLECIQCGQRVDPKYTADTNRQYAKGLAYCYINDQCVPSEEFERRAREAGLIG